MAGDADFSKVVLLLHADGANGSTTFTDSSPSAHTVNVGGATQLSTTQSKFSGGSSLQFNASGTDPAQCATITAGLADFSFPGDFTIEFFFFLTGGYGSWGTFLFSCALSDNSVGWHLLVDTSGRPLFTYAAGGVTADSAITLNVWNHFAATRSGSTIRMFINGTVQTTTLTDSGTVPASSFNMGRSSNVASTTGISGYVDEVRITKGVARYTATFAQPTAAHLDYAGQVSGTVFDTAGNPAARTVRAYNRETGALVQQTFTDASYDASYNSVVLLLHGNGGSASTTITDSSQTPKTVTAVGGAQISTAQAKFDQSVYFDGTGDYLTTPYVTSNFDWWTSDFTIEAWVYSAAFADWGHLDASVYHPKLVGNMAPTGTMNSYWSFGPLNSRVVAFRYWNGATNVVTSTETVTSGQWNHVALCKTSSGVNIFVNGVGLTSPVAVSGTPQSSATPPLTIGQLSGGAMTGYVDDLRITKGVARYTGTFTPPTTPHADRVSSPGLGLYSFNFPTTAELSIVALDDQVSGTISNDRVIRVIPA